MKQFEAVRKALEDLGGYATLGQIYQKALSYPEVDWGTRTPQASVRRILQQRSEFFKIRPGLWGLQARRCEILRALQIGDEATPAQVEAFDHAYYQGIIAEWGNLLRYHTYVPPQDHNRPFLGKRLRDYATIESIPPFTYPDPTKRASTVDVIWFAEFMNHLFPVRMFEVEHTTDFHNSLIKFRHFTLFKVEFYVVSPAHRRREFEEKILRDHLDLSKSVKFVAYEALAKVYSKEIERLQAYLEAGLAPL